MALNLYSNVGNAGTTTSVAGNAGTTTPTVSNAVHETPGQHVLNSKATPGVSTPGAVVNAPLAAKDKPSVLWTKYKPYWITLIVFGVLLIGGGIAAAIILTSGGVTSNSNAGNFTGIDVRTGAHGSSVTHATFNPGQTVTLKYLTSGPVGACTWSYIDKINKKTVNIGSNNGSNTIEWTIPEDTYVGYLQFKIAENNSTVSYTDPNKYVVEPPVNVTAGVGSHPSMSINNETQITLKFNWTDLSDPPFDKAQYRLLFSTSPNFGINTSVNFTSTISDNVNTIVANVGLSNLTAKTTYYWQLQMTNASSIGLDHNLKRTSPFPFTVKPATCESSTFALCEVDVSLPENVSSPVLHGNENVILNLKFANTYPSDAKLSWEYQYTGANKTPITTGLGPAKFNDKKTIVSQTWTIPSLVTEAGQSITFFATVVYNDGANTLTAQSFDPYTVYSDFNSVNGFPWTGSRWWITRPNAGGPGGIFNQWVFSTLVGPNQPSSTTAIDFPEFSIGTKTENKTVSDIQFGVSPNLQTVPTTWTPTDQISIVSASGTGIKFKANIQWGSLGVVSDATPYETASTVFLWLRYKQGENTVINPTNYITLEVYNWTPKTLKMRYPANISGNNTWVQMKCGTGTCPVPTACPEGGWFQGGESTSEGSGSEFYILWNDPYSQQTTTKGPYLNQIGYYDPSSWPTYMFLGPEGNIKNPFKNSLIAAKRGDIETIRMFVYGTDIIPIADSRSGMLLTLYNDKDVCPSVAYAPIYPQFNDCFTLMVALETQCFDDNVIDTVNSYASAARLMIDYQQVMVVE